MAKQIILVRQGKAQPAHGQQPSELTDKAKRTAQRMGVWLAQQQLATANALIEKNSCATTSAEKLIKASGKAANHIRVSSALVEQKLEPMLAELQSLSENEQNLLLVGEGEFLDKLIWQLLEEDLPEYKKGDRILKGSSLAVLRFDKKWTKLARNTCKLTYLIHRPQLPEQFPFPDPQSKEFRERPAYYYQQSAAVPYRIVDGKVQFLLISSSKNNHWLVPKGIVEPGLTAQDSAAKEAEEEAGVIGKVKKKALGKFVYQKWGADVAVTVFAMKVTTLLNDNEWQESHRERKWCSADKAQQLVKQAEFAPMISELALSLASSSNKS